MSSSRYSEGNPDCPLCMSSQLNELRLLRSVLNNGPAVVLVWRFDEKWPIHFASNNVSQFGYAAEDLLSGRLSWWNIVHPDDASRLRTDVVEHRDSASDEFHQSYRLVTAEGVVRWVEDHTAVIRNQQGKATHFQSILLDITERKFMAEAYENLVNESLQGLLILEGRHIVFANPAFCRMTGYILDILHGMSEEDLANAIHPDFRDKVWGSFERRLRGELPPSRYEAKLFRADGSEIWVEVFAKRIMHRGYPAIHATLVDITERKRTEAALLQSHERLRVLRRRLADTEERQRRFIAGELHDRVGQILTVMGMNINTMSKRVAAECRKPFLIRGLDQAHKQLEEVADTVRDIMGELRPPLLDEYGLVSALRWLAERTASRCAIDIRVREDINDVRLPNNHEIALFRVAQESLTNILKHAQATRAIISLTQGSGTLVLEIEDDGEGFDYKNHNSPNGWGLLGMEERVKGIGGRFRIRSRPGEATCITVEIPQEVGP